ncbi:MAG: AAA family ATPase, partial [Acidimicrobiales bacterium]
EPSDLLGPVVTADQVVEMSASLERVYLAPALRSYLLDLADATRRHPSLSLGLSPRGVLALQRVVRAHAASERRAYATPDDVKYLADYVIPLAFPFLVRADPDHAHPSRVGCPHRRQWFRGRRSLVRRN